MPPLIVLLFFSSCNLCEIIDCDKPPPPSSYYKDWVGEYNSHIDWYGDTGEEQRLEIEGQQDIKIVIRVQDSNLLLHAQLDRYPPGRLFDFETLPYAVHDSVLGFEYTDNWGGKGYGQMFLLDDGTYQFNTTGYDNGSISNVEHLHGRHNLLKKIPNMTAVYNSRAEAYYKNKDYSRAIRLTRTLLESYPKNPRALGNIGLFYLKRKNYEGAKTWMVRAITRLEDRTKKAEIYFNLGLLAEAEKDSHAALQYFKIAYYLNPRKAVETKLHTIQPKMLLPKPIASEHLFVSEPLGAFQQMLYTQKTKLRPEDVMKTYFSLPEGELALEKMQVNELQGFITEVIYTIEQIRDDSTSGIKEVLHMVWVNNQWEILEIQSSHKCHKGRGHQEWGTGDCL